jgi:hypothetical protein
MIKPTLLLTAHCRLWLTVVGFQSLIVLMIVHVVGFSLLVKLMINPTSLFIVLCWLWLNVVGCIDYQSSFVFGCSMLVFGR